MLRAIIVASAVCASTVAFAADLLPTKKGPAPAPYVPAAPAFTWTGFYIGVNGGYGGGDFRYPFAGGPIEEPSLVSGSARLNSSGFLGGGQAGFNYQYGSVVGGVEADIDASDIEGRLNANVSFPGGGVGLNAGSDVKYFGTVRARLGYTVVDRALLYVTGGLAYGDVRSSFNAGYSYDSDTGGLSGSESKTQVGWTLGGGLEYALTNNITFKTEYLYADLGKHTVTAGTIDDVAYSLDVETKLNIVRAGLNYKF